MCCNAPQVGHGQRHFSPNSWQDPRCASASNCWLCQSAGVSGGGIVMRMWLCACGRKGPRCGVIWQGAVILMLSFYCAVDNVLYCANTVSSFCTLFHASLETHTVRVCPYSHGLFLPLGTGLLELAVQNGFWWRCALGVKTVLAWTLNITRWQLEMNSAVEWSLY